jgi:hypothetical protein
VGPVTQLAVSKHSIIAALRQCLLLADFVAKVIWEIAES